ncbi:AarF/ABC1/UbiB kinase family protein [Undibacterium sp. Jales W-56]|uniref:ABC1 kinase family protein n=1 Tax=Undibacterium sp. Jales W-56 TaxID=2897325 RepID=UPI0021D25399|nr:AarF/ABC1/UbiB kinase family protein [Undibacterium sp. Jales W-56]MCU6434265.1 AarF/ABC1/UbiB kinase family protein [Undibacterium sp. Jales W-56]
MSKNPPSSKLGRSAISGLALAHVGISHVGHKARQLTRKDDAKITAQDQHEAELGRILFRALNQLKGTALKLSQMLSMETDFLPVGIRRELAKGCYQVTPLNRALVHKVFSREFGQAPEQVFAQFDAVSFAAASLGQVHHASLADGTQLAVKIQYPGIAASISSDIRMLRGLLHTMALGSDLIPRRELVDRIMSELEHKLAEELDYGHEAAQLRWFAERVRLPGIVIPAVLTSHSSQRILSMQRLDGLHLDEWLATGPDQATRDHYGQLLFDWFWHSVCELGRLHADPHPGNFLFMADRQLGVLDFGCTKSISHGFCASMAKAWHGLLDGKLTKSFAPVRLAYIELGLIRPELSLQDFETQLLPAAAALIDWQLQPFTMRRFDFRHKTAYPAPDTSHGKTLVRLAQTYHEDMPYFDRAYMGMMHMLKKIGAVVDTGNPWLNPELFRPALTQVA